MTHIERLIVIAGPSGYWIEFCRTYHARAHWLIDTTSDVPMWMDIAAWPDLKVCVYGMD